MLQSTSKIDRLRRRLPCSPMTLVVAVVVAAILLVAGVIYLKSADHAEDPIPAFDMVEEAVATPVAESEPTPDPYEVAAAARSALDAASGTDQMNMFYAETGVQRTLDSSESSAVDAAIAAFHEAGSEVGFVVYDLETQRGLGYNADASFFSASTVKAPFVAYVVQDLIDKGQASFDDEVVEDIVEEGTGIMAADDTDTYSLGTVLENTIVHSDNTGYALLRERFDQGGFEAWCAAAGVDAGAWGGEWYPYCSARDLAKLWLNTGAYISQGQESATWCKDLLLQTNSSFLREALGADHTVLSKPGYEIDTPWYDNIGALNDAGVVFSGTHAYVIAIMSDADYDDEYFTDNQHLIVDLAAALGAAHDQLLVEPAVA